MLDTTQIKALEDFGFSRWQKYGKDRLYATPYDLGLRTTKNNSGTLGSAMLNGEYISNRAARAMLVSKVYVDVKTGEVVSDNSELLDVAKSTYERIISGETE